MQNKNNLKIHKIIKGNKNNNYRCYFFTACRYCNTEIKIRSDVLNINIGLCRSCSKKIYGPLKPKHIFKINCELCNIKIETKNKKTKRCIKCRRIIHNQSNTRLYSIYQNMKNRCYNKNNKFYEYYGKQNIQICNEWLNSFEIFYNWSLNNGYNESLTIDRINTYKNYSPENCRWTTRQIQTLNTKSSKNSTSKYKGVSYSKHNKTNMWRSTIRYNAITYHLGYFKTEKNAALAYNKKAKKLNNNFLLNII